MDRPVLAAGRFGRTWRALEPRLKERVIDVIMGLPDLIAAPHRHSGFGFRRLHGSDYWEARLDLRWRLIVRVRTDEIVLFDVMSHDQVRRL
jgi:hypothetical protein